ncbi:MAG: hypothetical protein ACT4O9_07960 [Blastocatellia bacterium]
MSYDLYFIKSKRLSSENIDEFLEEEAAEDDEHFISNALKNEIRVTLKDNGLVFETFEGKEDDYLELNFESYQISMFNSQIAVSLPYWDVNSSDVIGNEIQLISKALFEKGFTGYDPQTSKFFVEAACFSAQFDQSNKRVNEYFSPDLNSKEPSRSWRLVKFGIGFFVLVLLIRLLASLLDRLF